jgi:predicted MFS family arabinose efflux permease
MGYSPLKAGVAFLPFTVGIVVGAGMASNLVNRIDPRYSSGVGTLFAAFMVIESRVEHPLLPFRVFTNRTRAASFAAMFLAPAAMFAMFYFLSQYIQNVMGYSPLKAGVAFLPFTVGIVFGAGLASNLVNRIDPRYISGVGTLIAAGALFGFSRLPYDTSFPPSDLTGSYLTDIMPFIIMMAFGMGLTFVPVTLTAVHHLRSEESGIGSGVLNTAQQVGGALGLAVLATVATQTFTDRGKEFAAAAASGPQPSPEQAKAFAEIAQQQIFTEGSTNAFLVGSILMLAASVVIWVFLDVKHEELATDGPEGVVAH